MHGTAQIIGFLSGRAVSYRTIYLIDFNNSEYSKGAWSSYLVSLYDEVTKKIKSEIPIPESEIQATLRLARERYKTELTASRDFHKQMAIEFENSGDNQLALRQRVLAEIYQSSIDRA